MVEQEPGSVCMSRGDLSAAGHSLEPARPIWWPQAAGGRRALGVRPARTEVSWKCKVQGFRGRGGEKECGRTHV